MGTTTTHRSTIPTTTTYTNNKNYNCNTDAYNTGGEMDDSIQSMSSKERTVINPLTKCKEIITEITVTKFDGSVEVRTEKRQQQTNNNKDDDTMKIRKPKSNKNKEESTIDIKKNKDKKKKKKAAKKENEQQQQQYIPMGQNKTTSFMNSSPT